VTIREGVMLCVVSVGPSLYESMPLSDLGSVIEESVGFLEKNPKIDIILDEYLLISILF
jgi:hypothetical protein